MSQNGESQKSVTRAEIVESITEISSFTKLYRVVRKIKTSKYIRNVFFLTFIIFGIFNFLGHDDLTDSVKHLIEYSNDLISWSVSILGFILAGYSIYSTLTDKKLNLALASFTNHDYQISYLIYTHAVFIKVIMEITVICLLSFSIQVVANSGFLTSVIKHVSETKSTLYFSIFFLTLIQSLFTYVLMSCLVFIYNVYHSIMTSIRWYAENSDEDEDEDS